MQLEGVLILVSAKLLFVEWILEVLRAISIYFLNKQARIKAEVYIEKNESRDIRTIPPAVKRGIIHDQSVLDKRWDLCSGCEFLTESNKCEKCGCFMKIKHKFGWASCPIGKWGKFTGKAVNGAHTTN